MHQPVGHVVAIDDDGARNLAKRARGQAACLGGDFQVRVAQGGHWIRMGCIAMASSVAADPMRGMGGPHVGQAVWEAMARVVAVATGCTAVEEDQITCSLHRGTRDQQDEEDSPSLPGFHVCERKGGTWSRVVFSCALCIASTLAAAT